MTACCCRCRYITPIRSRSVSLTALLKGAAVVFPSGISGPEITGAARAGEATVLLAVPRLCEALWDSVQAAVAQRGERANKLFFRMLGLSIAVRRTTGARLGKRLFRPVHERLGHGLDLIGCGGSKLDPGSHGGSKASVGRCSQAMA